MKKNIITFIITLTFVFTQPDLFQVNQSTLQAFFLVVNLNIDEVPVDYNDWVGAFKCNSWNVDFTECNVLGPCVGTRQWDTSLCGGGVCDIPLFGEDQYDETEGYLLAGDIPHFKIYDYSENTYYDALPSGYIEVQNQECLNGYPDCYGWANMTFYTSYLLTACTQVAGLPDECGVYGGTGPDENFDCEGNCLFEIDCAGVCGGESIFDECGVCGGPGEIFECGCSEIAIGDCDCNGNVFDDCQECGGDTFFGTEPGELCDCQGNVFDECAVCGGVGIPAGECDCAGNIEDCSGVCGGDTEVDDCGVCGGENECLNSNNNPLLHELQLHPVYPNPFNPQTTIEYEIPGAGQVQLAIYSLKGELLTTLVKQWLSPGAYTTVFDGSRFSSGFYLITLTFGRGNLNQSHFILTQKILLAK